MQMKQSELWKNFRLGDELDVSGIFIYNSLRRFHELRKLDYSADLFEVFYQLSVGIERLMKIAIVLLEHDDANDQDAFEKSLSTHNHQALLARVQKHVELKLANSDKAFLHLLTRFYENLRYDRFSLKSPLVLAKEKDELFDFLEGHLQVKFGIGTRYSATKTPTSTRNSFAKLSSRFQAACTVSSRNALNP